IPVDLLNPGQVFACIGFVEAAEVLLGRVDGMFDWSDSGDVRFRLRASGDTSPIMRVLAFLDSASASAIAPADSASVDAWVASWGPKPTAIPRALGYPFPDPTSPATLVCLLSDGEHEIRVDHYGDATERDNVKFWAGAGGYPGASLASDALALVAGRAVTAANDPFALSAPQSSSFRLDWRRDYIPLSAGFSLNRHSNIDAVGFPLVELLGAIGLTHARPKRPERRNKLEYVYGIAGRARSGGGPWLPPSILRAALGAAALPFPMRKFRMSLDWPGKEGQARSITTVTEETIP
ncbi:MAG: type I-U CRISPR-associated protein Cas8c, partial [Polyangiaceae bacterium]